MKSKTDSKSDIFQTLGIDHGSVHRKRWKRWIILTALSVFILAVVLIAWKNPGKNGSVQYITQPVQCGDLTVIVTATGTLQPTNKVEVGSELSGIIKSVEADYNSRVKVGQVLAKLDTLKLEAQVKQSRAALESAKGKVLQTQATVKETQAKLAQIRKVRALSDNKVPSQSELDAAEAAVDRALADDASAKAAVSQAQATLNVNETDLSKAVIRSPINGIVLSRSVEPGQTVAAIFQAPTLFTLAEDLTKMELHVNVDEADIGKVQEGQAAQFNVAAYPHRTFQARITQARYGSTTTSGVVTYETVLKVDNSDIALRPGMTANADIVVQRIKNAILVPNAALRFTPPTQDQTKQEEKIPSGGLADKLIFHRPPDAKSKNEDIAHKKNLRVWMLKDGQPVAVPVTVGSTNGTVTEVTAGNIKTGMALLVDLSEKKK